MTKKRKFANSKMPNPSHTTATRCGLQLTGHPAETRARRRDHELKCAKCIAELAASTNREEE